MIDDRCEYEESRYYGVSTIVFYNLNNKLINDKGGKIKLQSFILNELSLYI